MNKTVDNLLIGENMLLKINSSERVYDMDILTTIQGLQITTDTNIAKQYKN